jgi:hypothetical protein
MQLDLVKKATIQMPHATDEINNLGTSAANHFASRASIKLAGQ